MATATEGSGERVGQDEVQLADRPPCASTVITLPEGEVVSDERWSFDTAGRTQRYEVRQTVPQMGWPARGGAPEVGPGGRGEAPTVGSIREYRYDTAGNVVEERVDGDLDGEIDQRITTRYEADRPVEVQVDMDDDGVPESVRTYAYDARGNQVSEVRRRPAGETLRVTQVWSDADQLLERTAITGSATERVERTRFLYDDAGQLSEEIHEQGARAPGSATKTHEYGPEGHRRRTRHARGEDDATGDVTRYHYNREGLVVEEQLQSESGAVRRYRWFTYDDRGRVRSQVTGTDPETADGQYFRYDERGHPTEVTYMTRAEPHAGYTVMHHNTYDDQGRLVGVEFIGPDAERTFRHVHRYDERGLKVATEDWREDRLQRRWRFEYDEAGQLIRESCDGCTRDAPLADGVEDQTIHYRYDEAGQLVHEQLVRHREAQHWRILYTYDSEGQRHSEQTFEVASAEEPTTTRTFTRDGAGRIVTIVTRSTTGEPTMTIARTYDESGHQLSEIERREDGFVRRRVEWRYDALGRAVERTSDGRGPEGVDGIPDTQTTHTYECWNP